MKTFYEDLFINVSILLCFPSRMYDHDVDVCLFFMGCEVLQLTCPAHCGEEK